MNGSRPPPPKKWLFNAIFFHASHHTKNNLVERRLHFHHFTMYFLFLCGPNAHLEDKMRILQHGHVESVAGPPMTSGEEGGGGWGGYCARGSSGVTLIYGNILHAGSWALVLLFLFFLFFIFKINNILSMADYYFFFKVQDLGNDGSNEKNILLFLGIIFDQSGCSVHLGHAS